MRGTHGWAEVSRERKREIIAAIAANRATGGPVHVELDLTDRCNVACAAEEGATVTGSVTGS